MNKELALITLQKELEKKKRRNENAKKMRDRRGDELKEKNKEYARIHREKRKKELEEAKEILKNEEKPEKAEKPPEKPEKADKPPEKPKELPIKRDIVKIEKDRGEFISKVERTGIKGVCEKTAVDYINKISVVHKIVSEIELEKDLLKTVLIGKATKEDEKRLKANMEYLDNIEVLIKTIEDRYSNLQSRKAHLSSYMTLISYLSNIKKGAYEIIRQKFEEANNEIYGIRGDNQRAKNEEMIDIFDEEDIVRRADDLNMEDKIIYAYYTLQPPRRCEDVYMLTVIKSSEDNLDNDKNYIVVDEDNSPIEVIYNKYKTNKIYGRQTIKISNEILKSIIREYIYKNDIKEGERLYRRFSTANTFGDAIKRVFSKVYGKKITLNNIRHSYITWEMRELRSVNYLSNLAMMMGHSMGEQQLYRRI
jgi:hypothetical protein